MCDTIRTPWRHGQWVNSPVPSQLELESAKQRTSPGKPEPDEDDNLKQVDLIPGTFKSYTLSTLHARGTRYPQIVVQGCRFSALTRSRVGNIRLLSSIVVHMSLYIIFSYSATH